MQSELKVCPFCGHEQPKLFGESAPEWWVGCPACRASTECRTNRTDAIAAWNARADDVNLYLTALRRELELIESDPDSALSDGARRTIRWAMRNAAALKTSSGEGK